MNNSNKNKTLMNNKTFKKMVFTTFIAANIIMNLGYIQSRESSKVDLKKRLTVW